MIHEIINSIALVAGSEGVNVRGYTAGAIGASVDPDDLGGGTIFAISDNTSLMQFTIAANTDLGEDYADRVVVRDSSNSIILEQNLLDSDYLSVGGPITGWVIGGVVAGFVDSESYTIEVLKAIVRTSPVTPNFLKAPLFN